MMSSNDKKKLISLHFLGIDWGFEYNIHGKWDRYG